MRRSMLSPKAKRNARKFYRNAIRAMPNIPYVYERRSRSLLPFVLGAIGVATFGSVAAVLIFSPRTRYRALDAAKDAYGRFNDQIDAMGIAEKLGIRQRMDQRIANGLVSEIGSDFGPSGF